MAGNASDELVSVVLPTYNRARDIPDAIDSVLNQTHRDLELIIVNDGSRDETGRVVSSYASDTRVRYVEQENQGAAAARNNGIRQSTGQFVAFIDSDDVWEPEKLAIQLRVFAALPEVALVCSDFSAVNRDGVLDRSHIRSYFSVFNDYGLDYKDVFQQSLSGGVRGLDPGDTVYYGRIFETMLFGNLVLTSTCLCQRGLFDRIGTFDTSYKTLEDYDLYLRLTKEHDVALVDKPLVRYRYGGDQLSGERYFGQLCDNLIEIFDKNLAGGTDPEFLARNKVRIRRHRSMLHAQKANWYFAHDQHREAMTQYWRGIRLNPGTARNYTYLVLAMLPSPVVRGLRTLKTVFASRAQKSCSP